MLGFSLKVILKTYTPNLLSYPMSSSPSKILAPGRFTELKTLIPLCFNIPGKKGDGDMTTHSSCAKSKAPEQTLLYCDG